MEALVAPELIRWARERDRLSPAAAAKRLRVDVDQLGRWERGEERPSFREMEQFAERLNVPFGFLFLPSPPDESLPVPDLRTVAGQKPPEQSLELRDVLFGAIEKQEWYHDYLAQEGQEPRAFVGRYSSDASVEVVAGDIGATLGITAQLRSQCQGWEEFLDALVELTEANGVLVLRSGIVDNNTHRRLDPDEFRGFLLLDDLAPLVFINTQDAKSAQIFTLMHELAHIWIGQPGISRPDYRNGNGQRDSERFCEEVAAAVLLPPVEFRQSWRSDETIERNIQRLARSFKVSRLAAVWQARDLGFIDQDRYWAIYDGLRFESGTTTKGKPGGNFYNSLPLRNSRTLTLTVLSALSVGRVSYREASRLLRVRMSALDAAAQRVLGSSP